MCARSFAAQSLPRLRVLILAASFYRRLWGTVSDEDDPMACRERSTRKRLSHPDLRAWRFPM